MKKGKHLKRMLVTLCASSVLLTTMTAAAAGAHDGKLTDRADHTDLKFEEYAYERLDMADFDAIIEGLDELAADPANADQVLDRIIAMEDYFCEANRCYSIAHIHSDLVADDAYWDDEVMFWDKLTTDLLDKVMISYKTIAVSPNADVLRERVDDEDEWQDILDYNEMTEEQKELYAKDTELSLQFDILYNKEYTTKVDGRTYTGDELEEAYGNGTIDRNSYYVGYTDLLAQANRERGELYLELVDVRTQLARSYGYENFAEYAYEENYGRDYTSAELKGYRDEVKNYIVPLQDELIMELYGTHYDDYYAMYEQEMSEQECLDTLRKYLPEISSDLLVSLDYMEDHHLYDISVSDVKAPGGYTISISGYNAPFIFNCADGTISDMETLIHEFGHYNQMYHMTEDSWYYDKTDLDLAEIHSQGLELLFMEYAEDIYGEYAETMKLYTLFNLTYATVEGVKEDAFQYAVYSDPDDLTVEKLNQLYYDCCMEYSDRFGAMLNESISLGQQGYLPADQSYDWVRIPHTFQSPMYYISYSVSAAAVFELLDVILDDRDEGIETYLALVDAEFQEGFQDTLDTVGLNNPIANPRFDLYADDIRYALGLAEERTVASQYEPHQPTTYWGAVTEGSGSGDGDSNAGTDVTPGQEDPAEDEDDTDYSEGRESAVREALSRMVIAGVVACVLFGAAVVIIVVVIVKYNKEKKAKEGIALTRPGAGANPYMPAAGSFIQTPVRDNMQQPQSSYLQPNPYAGSNVIPPAQQAGSTQQGMMWNNASTNPQSGAPFSLTAGMQGSGAGIDGSGLPIAPQQSTVTDQGSQPIRPVPEISTPGNVSRPINPYAQQVQINPYAGQSLQINPYAQQTAPNPYLQNLQNMQKEMAASSLAAPVLSAQAEDKPFTIPQSSGNMEPVNVMGTAPQSSEKPAAVNAMEAMSQSGANPAVLNTVGAVPQGGGITESLNAAEAVQQSGINDPAAREAYLREMAQRIPQEGKDMILDLIRSGQTLQAIKVCREQSGAGLADAKTLVDEYLKYL